MCSSKLAGMPEGRVHGGIGHRHAFGSFDAFLDLAHAGQVLIQFLAVASVEVALDGAGVVHDKIQNGLLLLLAAFEIGHALIGRARAEEPLEDQPGIWLGDTGWMGERQARLYS
jgi:hypothetical protein